MIDRNEVYWWKPHKSERRVHEDSASAELSEAQDGRIDGDNGQSRKARDEREMEIPGSSTAMPFPCIWTRMRDLPW